MIKVDDYLSELKDYIYFKIVDKPILTLGVSMIIGFILGMLI